MATQDTQIRTPEEAGMCLRFHSLLVRELLYKLLRKLCYCPAMTSLILTYSLLPQLLESHILLAMWSSLSSHHMDRIPLSHLI